MGKENNTLPQICSGSDNPSEVEEWEAQWIYDCEDTRVKKFNFTTTSGQRLNLM